MDAVWGTVHNGRILPRVILEMKRQEGNGSDPANQCVKYY